MKKVLIAGSEVFPFIKTGGLADVLHALPAALTELGVDVRVVLPAYRSAVEACDSTELVTRFEVQGAMGSMHKARLLDARHEGIREKVYMIDIPSLYDREGDPYLDENGVVWADNAERFIVFCRAVAGLHSLLADDGDAGESWRADIVHCNDWQTGLVPAFLESEGASPSTVFTIHNLSYDGYFPYDEFERLGLPSEWWSQDGLEFYQGFSMLKGGMVFSDAVTTVSPTYAEEIKTEQFGYRFEGVLDAIGDRFSGILNGIDTETWDPATDPNIIRNYSCDRSLRKNKLLNKLDLLKQTCLPVNDVPLLGFIGRFVEQKGVDLIIDALPGVFESSKACVVMLGSGQEYFEEQLLELASEWPGRLHVHVGYDEVLAHKIEAGCDVFLMPSKFEPCGLNQMYSLRYGTLPIVTFTGGLADTVVDTTLKTIQTREANGFVMKGSDSQSLSAAIDNALELYASPLLWKRVQENGMQHDFSWTTSAKRYTELYETITSIKAMA